MTQKRMAFLKELLNFIGIHPDRLNVTWVSSSEAALFAQAVEEFTGRVRELGPSPLRLEGWKRVSPLGDQRA